MASGSVVGWDAAGVTAARVGGNGGRRADEYEWMEVLVFRIARRRSADMERMMDLEATQDFFVE